MIQQTLLLLEEGNVTLWTEDRQKELELELIVEFCQNRNKLSGFRSHRVNKEVSMDKRYAVLELQLALS